MEPPAPPSNPESSALETLEKQLRSLVDIMLEASIAIHDVEGPQSNQIVASKLKETVSQFQSLLRIKDSITETVPQDVLQYIEDGRNPDVYTRDFVELVRKDNQFVNGKIKAARDFALIFGKELQYSFPELKDDVERVWRATGLGEATEEREMIKEGQINGNTTV
ncbi:Mediator of RNA polymerase II transcription subunit 10 [Neolecta irregularis DAH-3]|uniref:Mediator of RNA polymerase II transcription subunit 10 n=1 Tax=Neolecta irregularis (strain DAH-3) TaxID=1198029 RepID=A0A1U7LIY0_NEOID|nr:Mediator of RNA polymerase II transcription subunit 10 [Neolecta irregularis DAH-3]|eukprot:OLL22604.1 Mediator of RNA polymerase II transcription subunit 10 [Neolecta irregularis DAH-3]